VLRPGGTVPAGDGDISAGVTLAPLPLGSSWPFLRGPSSCGKRVSTEPVSLYTDPTPRGPSWDLAGGSCFAVKFSGCLRRGRCRAGLTRGSLSDAPGFIHQSLPARSSRDLTASPSLAKGPAASHQGLVFVCVDRRVAVLSPGVTALPGAAAPGVAAGQDLLLSCL